MSVSNSTSTASGKPSMVYYNGYRANEHVVGPLDHVTGKENKGHVGARRLGVENMAAKAIQGRAVMIDLEAHYGHDRKLVSFDDLMQIMKQDKVEVEQGDMVCLRTGFAQRLLDMKKNPDEQVLHHSCAALDGRDERLLNWITKSGLVSLIADNYAVEASPSRECDGGSLRGAAAARALPLQARRQSRRDLVPDRARRLAARAQAQPLPADRAAAAPARRRRLAGDAGGDGVATR